MRKTILLFAFLLAAGCGKKFSSTPLSSTAPSDVSIVGMTPSIFAVEGTQVSAKLSVTSGQTSTQGTQVGAKLSIQ